MNTSKLARLVALSGLSVTTLYAAQPPNPSSVLSDGSYDTAMGLGALSNDVTPTRTCVPLDLNPSSSYMSGCANTASGFFALNHNTTGYGNSASGTGTLYANTNGYYNTATGLLALFNNTTGANNVANGSGALFANTTGSSNVAIGSDALAANTAGTNNVATGPAALTANSTGNYNVATGPFALNSNTTGVRNVAVGFNALLSNTIGNSNVAVGTGAGSNLITGVYNTYVGWGVTALSGADKFVTRIGAAVPNGVTGTPTTYISGIWGTTLSGSTAPVVINANGQLGVTTSSERYKTDVAALGNTSERLAQLRPVSFHLKNDPRGATQYGLIAEEVNKVYPELVIRDNDGRIEGVRYDELAPMLLNEMQKLQATVAAQARQAAAQDAQLGQLRTQLAEIHAALSALQPGEERVAQR